MKSKTAPVGELGVRRREVDDRGSPQLLREGTRPSGSSLASPLAVGAGQCSGGDYPSPSIPGLTVVTRRSVLARAPAPATARTPPAPPCSPRRLGDAARPGKAPRDSTLTILPPLPMCRTTHQVTLAAPRRLTASVSDRPGLLPLLVGDLEDLLPGVDAGIVHQDVDAAHGPSDAVHHLADGGRVGEAGQGEDVTRPGQRAEDLLG